MDKRRQGDMYFRVPHGRLKLRRIRDSPHGTLIYYDRPDRPESRYSEYHLAPVNDAEEIEPLLGATLARSSRWTRPDTCFCSARRVYT